jgi:hypothetical protein
MENLGALNILRIPLQILWEFADVSAKIQTDGPGFRKDLIAWFNKYEPQVQQDLCQQLNWAVEHPSYDFRSMLKNIKTPNEDIVRYFTFLRDAVTEPLVNQDL